MGVLVVSACTEIDGVPTFNDPFTDTTQEVCRKAVAEAEEVAYNQTGAELFSTNIFGVTIFRAVGGEQQYRCMFDADDTLVGLDAV